MNPSAPQHQRHVYDYFIDEHGKWFCEGNPVEDPELFRLLSRSLFEKDGGYFIKCEGEVHPVRTADAPLWVRYIHPRTTADGMHQEVEIELEDGRREPLDPETLRVRGERALYCRATRKRLLARFGKVAYYELARYIDLDQDGFYIVLGGRRYPIRAL